MFRFNLFSQNVTGLTADGIEVVVDSGSELNLTSVANKCGATVVNFVVDNSTQLTKLCSSSKGTLMQVWQSSTDMLGGIMPDPASNDALDCVIDKVCGVPLSTYVLVGVSFAVLAVGTGVAYGMYKRCKRSPAATDVEMQRLNDGSANTYGTPKP